MPNALTTFMDRAGISSRIGPILVGVVTAGVIWSLASYGMAPSWVPVASGLPLGQIDEATTRLTAEGIDSKLSRGGTLITVADRDLARARVVLAAEGLTGASDAPGFELFDQPAWGMTDFTQRINYRRALEGELERTIGQMRGVEAAQVHLAIRERAALAGPENGSEASVVLRLTGGRSAAGSVVEGVQSLVASSVEALDPEAVTVLDDRGRLLSTTGGDDSASLTNVQLKVRRDTEQYLEEKAQALVAQIVGAGYASVRVAAQLNFDQIDRTVQAVDPDQQLMISEDRSEIVPGREEQGAGSVTSNTVFETTRSTETVQQNGARIERLTVAVVVGDIAIENDDGTVTFQARTADELRRIETIVANSVGISPDRGDQISVMNAQIAPVAAPIMAEEGIDVAGVALAAQRPAIALAGLVFAFLLSNKVLGTLKTLQPAPRTVGRLSDSEPVVSVAAAPEMPMMPEPAPAPRIQMTDPDMTARVLRNWMQEG